MSDTAEAMQKLGRQNATIDLAVNNFAWYAGATKEGGDVSEYGRAYVTRFAELLRERERYADNPYRMSRTAPAVPAHMSEFASQSTQEILIGWLCEFGLTREWIMSVLSTALPPSSSSERPASEQLDANPTSLRQTSEEN